VVVHKEHGCYVPTLILGHLLTVSLWLLQLLLLLYFLFCFLRTRSHWLLCFALCWPIIMIMICI
jgi:hypothetical protein